MLPDEAPRPAAPFESPVEVVRIEPGGGRWRLSDLWRYRELALFLAWRDVKVRYRQTILGAAWALLQPLLTVLVLVITFGRFAGFAAHTGEVPYGLFVLCGLLPWSAFAGAVAAANQALLSSAGMMTKVYFPRILVPLASLGTVALDFVVSLALLGAMVVYYGLPLSSSVVLILPALAITALSATGVGCLMSALGVVYRDFRHVIPFTLQLWMFATPVIYPLELVPARWRQILVWNPMAGAVELFRSAVLNRSFEPMVVGSGALTSLALFLVGVWYFRSFEREFADVI